MEDDPATRRIGSAHPWRGRPQPGVGSPRRADSALWTAVAALTLITGYDYMRVGLKHME